MIFNLYTKERAYSCEDGSVSSLMSKLTFTWIKCEYMGDTYYVRSKLVRYFRVIEEE